MELSTLAIDTSDFKNGISFYLDGDVFTIIEFQHVKPGKGGAFVRTRLRKIKNGAVLEKTFRSGEKVEPAFIEKLEMQFIDRRGGKITLMDLESYEQVEVEEANLGEQAKYLFDDSKVLCLKAGEEVLGYELPSFMELEVKETDPGVRGDTVSGGATKPATLVSGAIIQVPFHINPGDILKIDTRTDTYLERVKR